jgi:hypothetical protein
MEFGQTRQGRDKVSVATWGLTQKKAPIRGIDAI